MPSPVRKAAALARDSWLKLTDPQRISERLGRRVAFAHLQENGYFEDMEGKRILEIGPKHGHDTRLLAALNPSELVLIDLADKTDQMADVVNELSEQVPIRYIETNLLYTSDEQLEDLGTFDLIFCLGVLYHNVEQIRLLRKLFNLLSAKGKLVLESATTRNRRLEKRNVVEIHWPSAYRDVQTVTHIPSRKAIESWLEMVGFADTTIWHTAYCRRIRWQRTIITATRPTDAEAYASHNYINGTAYVAGESC